MNMISRLDPRETETPHAKQPRNGRLRLISIAILAMIVAIGAAVGLLVRAPAPVAAAVLPTVAVATPLQRDVTEWDDYVGRFAPSQSVEIRPRVSGAVTAIHFHDGDIVHQGQLLFTIDQRPFAASFAEANAGVASAQSALALATSDLARASRLHGDEGLSAGELDALRAHVQSAQAALAGAQARQTARSLDVEFTEVRAPITGRVSDRRIDIGNLVVGGEGSAATLLTSINALDPIYFTFDGSEALYLKAQRQKQAGAPVTPVEIRLQDETDYRWKGQIDFTDNGLNPHSGTIRGRATLANPDNFLIPGMFGNMRLAVAGKTHVLLVPDAAVQTDQARKIVLTVGADNIVKAVPVEVGPVIDGLRIVRSGLSPDAKVVIGGIPFASPGSEVHARADSFGPEPASAAPLSVPVSAEATFADR